LSAAILTRCPRCGTEIPVSSQPALAVDCVIAIGRGIVLVRRRNPPYGWALPGGLVEYGECLEDAARREIFEETGLRVTLEYQLGTYSHPNRDPRRHTVTAVFVGRAAGRPMAGDDASAVKVCDLEDLPLDLAFDHALVLEDYRQFLQGKRPACPART